MLELMQIESTDLPVIKEYINNFNDGFIPQNKEASSSDINSFYESILDDPNSYYFSLKVSIPGDFKKPIVGFAAIKSVDWVSRHAELSLVLKEYQNIDLNLESISILSKFAFSELNLNKIWWEVYLNSTAQEILPQLGWVLEGVRRHARYKAGQWRDATVYSILSQEFRS